MKHTTMKNIFILALTSVFSLYGCKEPVQVEPNIEVSGKDEVQYSEFKVVSYNILEGMKNDKAANYDNFVEWVKKQNPDVLALQECNGFTESSLKELAQRWGHTDARIMRYPNRYYPVAITSKHPIEVVKYMPENAEDNSLWHNAIHAKIKGFNFVVLHLYPFGLYPNTSSSAEGSGEEYRISEMTYILDSTMRKYLNEPDWLMMGDFNSVSPYDKEHLGNDWYYDLHSFVLENGYYDAVRERHNHFINSTSANRLDFIYTSKSLLKNIIEADIIKDEFTTSQVQVSEGQTEQISDHYPVTVTFRYK